MKTDKLKQVIPRIFRRDYLEICQDPKPDSGADAYYSKKAKQLWLNYSILRWVEFRESMRDYGILKQEKENSLVCKASYKGRFPSLVQVGRNNPFFYSGRVLGVCDPETEKKTFIKITGQGNACFKDDKKGKAVEAIACIDDTFEADGRRLLGFTYSFYGELHSYSREQLIESKRLCQRLIYHCGQPLFPGKTLVMTYRNEEIEMGSPGVYVARLESMVGPGVSEANLPKTKAPSDDPHMQDLGFLGVLSDVAKERLGIK